MWQAILNHFITIIVAIVTPLAIYAAHRLIGELVKKWHISSLYDYQAQVDSVVEMAIQAVEKKALSLAKADGVKMSNVEKLNSAIAIIKSEMARLGLPDISAETITARIEAALFDNKI